MTVDEDVCAARFARITSLETATARVENEIGRHGAQIQHLGDKIDGLANAHQATLAAVQASTQAVDRLGHAINRFDARMDKLATDYSEHKVSAASEKYTLPRVAIWLWATSIAALGSLAALTAMEWRELLEFLRGSQ